jgi:hypothetical protein
MHPVNILRIFAFSLAGLSARAFNHKLRMYRVYKKKRNLGISQEIDIVLKTKDFRRLGI